MQFEWDDEKSERTRQRCGIDFDLAKLIWSGPLLEREDNRRDYGEVRMIAYGRAGDRILTVVYTMRGETVRIISARKANRNEQEAYRQALAERGAGED